MLNVTVAVFTNNDTDQVQYSIVNTRYIPTIPCTVEEAIVDHFFSKIWKYEEVKIYYQFFISQSLFHCFKLKWCTRIVSMTLGIIQQCNFQIIIIIFNYRTVFSGWTHHSTHFSTILKNMFGCRIIYLASSMPHRFKCLTLNRSNKSKTHFGYCFIELKLEDFFKQFLSSHMSANG